MSPAAVEDAKWSRAFAKQALSDMNARDILAGSNADKCQRLHFLQMAAEKLCKASLIASLGKDGVANKHCYVAKHLPSILIDTFAAYPTKKAVQRARLVYFKQVSAEIQSLAPACDAGGSREDNVEYPWLSGDLVMTPADYSFPNLDHTNRQITDLIRAMRAAAETYL